MEIRDMVAVAALLVAILLGPVTAVSITLWWQRRKEIREEKMRLFMTLMSHRRVIPINPEWVRALNLIDVVFAGHTKVVGLWHHLYGLWHTSPAQEQAINHTHIELLSEMASVLKFQVQQVNIDKYYYPQVYEDQLKAQAEMQSELLRILKNTEAFVVSAKEDVSLSPEKR